MLVNEQYLNAQPPPISPTASFESIPVIARFVGLDGSECWKPGTAVRWAASVVLVSVGSTFHKDYTWLPADDVTRAIRPDGGHASW
jgi:hypothetical protein